jgi:hypothetical protein
VPKTTPSLPGKQFGGGAQSFSLESLSQKQEENTRGRNSFASAQNITRESHRSLRLNFLGAPNDYSLVAR